MTDKLFVLTINIDGEDPEVYLHKTQEGARKNLADWCRNYWEDCQNHGGPEVPESDGEVIETYFDYMSDSEFFTINEEEVLP